MCYQQKKNKQLKRTFWKETFEIKTEKKKKKQAYLEESKKAQEKKCIKEGIKEKEQA